MKKKQTDQLLSLLHCLGDTIQNPEKLFAITMTLFSGKNRYPADISIKENSNGDKVYQVVLIGEKRRVSPDGLMNLIRELAQQYDGVEITFYERGGGKRFSADDRNVKISTVPPLEIEGEEKNTMEHTAVFSGVSATRDYYIRVDEATVLLKAIGILDEQNKVRNDKIRKYNQIDRFVELADPMIQEAISRREPLHILDCACGKSYLSFVLNFYIREKCGYPCEFLGLDWSESVVQASKKLAEKLKYTNMKFMQCDLAQFQPDQFKPTFCISLHACDTATDLAIYTGIRSGAKTILCVPCCQKELLNSSYSIPDFQNSILRHGLLKARFSDIMTDGLRVLLMEGYGYQTSVVEYISPLDSPKNIMLRGQFTGKKNKGSLQEYAMLKDKFNCEITLGKLLENKRWEEDIPV